MNKSDTQAGFLEALAHLVADEVFERIKPLVEQQKLAPAANQADAPVWTTEREAAKYIGMSRPSLQAWRSQGTGPKFSRIGHSIRYKRADLDSFMEKSKRGGR